MKINLAFGSLPKMPNELLGANWRKRVRHSDVWTAMIRLAVARSKPPSRATVARLVCTRHSSVEPDYDGLVGSFKAPIDALVKCGVLVNDHPGVIGQPVYKWEKAAPRKGKITIDIEILELEDNPNLPKGAVDAVR